MYGTDIKIVNGHTQIAANGELALVNGGDTVVQDLMLSFETYLGALFYNKDYGSYVMDFVKDEDSPETRFALCQEFVRRAEAEPRVQVGTVSAKVAAWDLQTITISLSFSLIDSDTVLNLVLALDKTTKEMRII